jgi:hypothetical protein
MKIGHHEYLMTFFIVITVPQIGAVSTQKHSGHIVLSDDGQSFTAQFVTEFCNSAGQSCRGREVSARSGQRILIEDLQ